MHRTVTALVLAAFACAGCGAGQTRWNGAAARLATYATQIPLYPGTEIEDSMGSESWGDEADSHVYGMVWWCNAKASKEELIAWYEKALPNATHSAEEDGYYTLKVTPPGAKAGEDMGVYFVDDGSYRVFEHTKVKKPGV
jgi:hypothetical protein